MRFLPLLILSVSFISCKHSSEKNDQKVVVNYTPGLGEFMSNIQVHHAKLWFAGKNENWELADFEMHEIMEALENIRKFNSDRQEIKSIGMIKPSLDSVSAAIANKNAFDFTSSYNILTNTCNSCHAATGHGYNVIKVPETPPFSNQEFKKQ